MAKKFEGIQILRGIAACMVVVHHIYNDGFLPGTIVDFGAFGVDLFFCLSGFIMCYTVRNNYSLTIVDGLNFLSKRFVRILPLYIVVASPLIFYSFYNNDLGRWYHVIGNLFLLPSLHASDNYGMILPPAWTLVYEMLFYYLFALSLGISKSSNSAIVKVLIVLVSITIIFKILFPSEVNGSWVSLEYIVNNIKVLNFSFGIICYFIYERFKDKLRVSYLSVLCISLILCFILMLIMYLKHNLPLLTVIFSATIVLMLIFVDENSFSNRYIRKYLLLIGNASFSIYLIHYYFEVCKKIILPLVYGVFKTLSPTILINIMDLFFVLLSIVLGIIVYRFVETPLNNFNRKFIIK